MDPTTTVDLGTLPTALGYLLRRAQVAVFADFITSLEEVGLRPGQFSALLVIAGNPGLSQRELCAALSIQEANFVPMMNGLVRRRLALRRPSAADHRRHALHLTARGATLLRRAQALQRSHEARLTARLGATGRATLTRLLRELQNL
jgi:DNA-binding MarR family transcriptional regulator